MLQITSHLQNEVASITGETTKINGNFKGQDILSLDQFSTEDLRILFTLTRKMKQIAINNEPSYLLAGTIVSLLFFEPSSRTFGSFA